MRLKTRNEPFEYLPISFVSMLLIALVLILGIVAGVNTIQAEDESNENWEKDRNVALATGAFTLVFGLMAIPCQFMASSQYQKHQRSSQSNINTKGNKCCMITSWVLYGLSMFNGLIVFALGASRSTEGTDTYLAGPVFSFLFWLCLSWCFMFAHAEAACSS